MCEVVHLAVAGGVELDFSLVNHPLLLAETGLTSQHNADESETTLTGERQRERMGRMWKRCFCTGGWVWLAAFMAWAAEGESWFPFDPKPDTFAGDSAIDLRALNERFAGEQGFIEVKDGQFIHNRPASRCGSGRSTARRTS